jgi:FHA domain-containing protein
MTVVCPDGHESAAPDYCDQCGLAISPTSSSPQPTEVLPVVEEEDTSPATRQQPCPSCQAPRSGDDRYCEECGHDFLAPVPAAAAWEVVATADRDQFRRFEADGLTFPTDYGERRFALRGSKVRIGRSKGVEGEPVPEIDLADPPADPGISREHAVLERQNDGTYLLRDLGSTNGTAVNENPTPLGSDAAVPLADGDRVRVGAWTTLTLRAR